MSFFRSLRHLLPDAAAWRLTIKKTLRNYLEGLAAPFSDARVFADLVWEDLIPSKTRELTAWERQFGLEAAATDSARRLNLEAAWAAQGGQDPRYLQDTLQAAGFDLYIHEWWEPPGGSPWTARDPRLHTKQPLVGTVQCGEPLAQCGEPTALANAFLANEPGYLVNKDLTPRAPPRVPDDSAFWPYFLYFGGETFGDRVLIPASRRNELERLVLRICPTQQWIVMLVDYDEAEGIFDSTFDFTFE